MSAVHFGGWRASGEDVARARRTSLVVGGLAVMIAGAYGATLVATEDARFLVAPLVGAVVGVAVFARPVVGLYLLFGAAILLEQWEITGLAPPTAQTHFFENISNYSALPVRLSASDILALLTAASWAVRRAVGACPPMRAGPFGWGVAAYGLAFVLGAIIGASRGGAWDEITMLAEARGPIYACLLYFLAANLVRERGQIIVLLWEFVLLVGLKAFQALGNYAEMISGPYRLEAVTGHEDVVFFDIAIVLALVMAALRVRGRLFYVLIALQPVLLAAEVVTQRRVAFVAVAAALAVVALMSFVDHPRRTLLVVAVASLAFAAYTATFWDSHGRLAEPLRVIREVVDPYSVTERDRLSNVWREIENANIAYTVRQLPLTGVGLGQQYLFEREPPPLSAAFVYWRYMTHNAILWMWLKAGPFGAFAFWFLVAQVLIVGLRLYRRLGDPLLRAAASFPVLLTVAQVVFSSVDLGLTYNRNMIVLGIALGIAAQLAAWSASQRGLDRTSPPAPATGGRRRTSPPGSPQRLGESLPTLGD